MWIITADDKINSVTKESSLVFTDRQIAPMITFRGIEYDYNCIMNTFIFSKVNRSYRTWNVITKVSSVINFVETEQMAVSKSELDVYGGG